MTVKQWLREVAAVSVPESCPVATAPQRVAHEYSITIGHLKRMVAALEYLRDHPDIGPDAVRARAEKGLA